ncbi:Crp/Fnr family transcriptional regulator [Colwellia sp. C1TZA3]|uniref:Crp/Fnr family transcriptional regulator n=1 Tax=Colwellia sp. C1TZA3 TaxID=2508879 RepID=UPI0011BA2C41|nr:Crp/Fnr family transcriptional regulator [Colwellia sp. C1TZA3]TWX63505.1 Crp/Fnr family transcriptional regulator [Colwellia sp. C1TZA3]
MQLKEKQEITNQLLDGLPKPLQKTILAQCDIVNLTFGDILVEQGKSSRYVFYPLTGVISLVRSGTKHPPLELYIIGNEGMLGVTNILGVNSAPERAVVQGSGTALRLSIEQFQYQLKHYPRLLKKLNDYLYILLVQCSKSLVCMRFHQIEPRLARWLLMIDDRAHANPVYLTHQLLADMLGVRRSGITVAAGALQDKKLISYTRGNIDIVDRKGLELQACECYQLMKADYVDMFN